MKAKSFLFSMLAAATLVGCSSDDVMEEVGGHGLDNAEKAYLTVQLVNAGGTNSRATEGDFEYGSEAENKVESVDLYFYNENGTFNQYVNNVVGFDKWTSSNNDPAINVEKTSNAVVVLQDLLKKGTPRYVVALVNAEDNLLKDKTLSEAKKVLAGGIKNGDGFVMSNSTYNNKDANSGFFATRIDDTQFLTQAPNTKPQADSENSVSIYVERLAARVSVAPGTLLTPAVDGSGYTIGSYYVNDQKKDIKIKILGWGISGTNKNSYIVKNVDPTFKPLVSNVDQTKTWDWTSNTNTNKRSYWGHSYMTYDNGSAKYPTTSNDFKGGTPLESALNYLNADAIKNPMTVSTFDYCAENTNTAGKLSSNFFNKVTHVLIKAETVGENNQPLELIRYTGMLYTPDNFYKRVASQLQDLPYYADKNKTNTYTQLDDTDLVYKDLGDGRIQVVLSEGSKNLKWYKGTMKDGQVTIDPNKDEVQASVVAGAIESKNIEAEYYKQGLMYYNVPIQHFANLDTDKNATDIQQYVYNASNNTVTTNEGNFGVVRNHSYHITINKIENLGQAIVNPGEAIVIPNKTQKYYVGAQINILSWKVVNQNVDL